MNINLHTDPELLNNIEIGKLLLGSTLDTNQAQDLAKFVIRELQQWMKEIEPNVECSYQTSYIIPPTGVITVMISMWTKSQDFGTRYMSFSR